MTSEDGQSGEQRRYEIPDLIRKRFQEEAEEIEARPLPEVRRQRYAAVFTFTSFTLDDASFDDLYTSSNLFI